jgi:uncharacterized protein YbjT (DUF2867 family)
MRTISAAVIGGSGLIGSELLSCLLRDDRYGQIHLLTRRNLGIVHPKLTEYIIDFSDTSAMRML